MDKDKKRRMIFGPVGGMVEAMIMQPFDTIKVRRQSNQYIGLGPTIRKFGISNLNIVENTKNNTPNISNGSIKLQRTPSMEFR